MQFPEKLNVICTRDKSNEISPEYITTLQGHVTSPSDTLHIFTFCLAKENHNEETLKHVKRKTIQVLCTNVSQFTLYPNGKDFDNMCFALIKQYPFLKR